MWNAGAEKRGKVDWGEEAARGTTASKTPKVWLEGNVERKKWHDGTSAVWRSTPTDPISAEQLEEFEADANKCPSKISGGSGFLVLFWFGWGGE